MIEIVLAESLRTVLITCIHLSVGEHLRLRRSTPCPRRPYTPPTPKLERIQENFRAETITPYRTRTGGGMRLLKWGVGEPWRRDIANGVRCRPPARPPNSSRVVTFRWVLAKQQNTLTIHEVNSIFVPPSFLPLARPQSRLAFVHRLRKRANSLKCCAAWPMHCMQDQKPIPAHCLEKWRIKTQGELKSGKHEWWMG